MVNHVANFIIYYVKTKASKEKLLTRFVIFRN